MLPQVEQPSAHDPLPQHEFPPPVKRYPADGGKPLLSLPGRNPLALLVLDESRKVHHHAAGSQLFHLAGELLQALSFQVGEASPLVKGCSLAPELRAIALSGDGGVVDHHHVAGRRVQAENELEGIAEARPLVNAGNALLPVQAGTVEGVGAAENDRCGAEYAVAVFLKEIECVVARLLLGALGPSSVEKALLLAYLSATSGCSLAGKHGD